MEILIIDDDPDVRALVELALRRLHAARVRGAASGAAGLEEATRSPPDLILLDVNMPVLDGIGTFLALRARGVAAPIVFLTAQSHDTDELRALGAAAVVHKPFRVSGLVDELLATPGLAARATGL